MIARAKCVRLVAHKVFTPTPGDPIDFEEHHREDAARLAGAVPAAAGAVRSVSDGGGGAAAGAGADADRGISADACPNLTATTSNLFDLISARQLVLYPDAGMRLAISHAIIIESSRGWRLDKMKQQHKIDVVVALSMACLGGGA